MSDTSPKPLSSRDLETPKGNLDGFLKYIRFDLLSGFLVFLIALPLCLGIARASGFPPVAGLFTAIIGALVTTFISNSEMTIKGPAAGLIVIVIGCIQDFGGDGMTGGWTDVDMAAYRAALAVGVAAAVLQILFGLFRAGILGEFFPSSAVHGMLAAIGVIIIAKQIPVALGVETSIKEPLELLREVPNFIKEANPAIAAIGVVSVLIMFFWPLLGKLSKYIKAVPSPVVVLLVAVPLGYYFDLLHAHSYMLREHQYQLSDQYLVKMPEKSFGIFNELAYPDFTALAQAKAWWWVFMFFAIGSLESLLSSKAVDMLDPWKRKTNQNRDILAVGVGNLCSAFVGGLPMISEIVRSRANIDNGARTRFADMWHGLFLLACVALIPMVIHQIPNAALAAMLVYTGYRLAHPTEFLNVWRIGKEQLAIFVTTLIVVLATDLLIGVAAGIILKMVIHIANGVPLKSLFKPYLEIEEIDDNTSLIIARHSAVFSNWIPFRRQIEQIGLVQKRNLIVDVSNAKLVDHSVMEKLEEVERDFEREGLHFEVRGLDSLKPFSASAHSARKAGMPHVKRVTIFADESLEEQLVDAIVLRGASGYTITPCRGAGRRTMNNGSPLANTQIRVEVIATESVADQIVEYLRQEQFADVPITTCVETVEVIRLAAFGPLKSAKEVQHA